MKLAVVLYTDRQSRWFEDRSIAERYADEDERESVVCDAQVTMTKEGLLKALNGRYLTENPVYYDGKPEPSHGGGDGRIP